MGGKSSSGQTSSQSQQSTTNPWAPAQPALQGILSGIQGQLGNYQPNGLETGAIQQLTQNAQNAPNYGDQANGVVSGMFGGDPTGLLTSGLKDYKAGLTPYSNGDYLNPLSAPGMKDVLSTIRNDVSNSVNGQFAGAGRDLSGMNQGALARGISQGEAQPLLDYYQKQQGNQLNALTSLYGASGNTAGAMTGNMSQAFNLAPQAPQIQNINPNSVLAAQSAGRSLPLQNLGMLENLTVPIAGLGGQSQGSGTFNGQSWNQASPMQMAQGWAGAFNSALAPWSKFGAFGGG